MSNKWSKKIGENTYERLHENEIIHLDNIMQAGIYDLLPLYTYVLCDENGENEDDPDGDHIKMLKDVKYMVRIYVKD